MKKLTTSLLAVLIVLSVKPSQIYAQTLAGSSAQLSFNHEPESRLDMRVMALKNVLEKYNSELSAYAPEYVKSADRYSTDWKLLPAISGVESTFGRAYIRGTYNVYGWGSGRIYFDSWEHGIDTINSSLREKYMDKWGAKTVWEIGRYYAESKTWAPRVNFFMNQFEDEHKRLASKTTLLL
jgi:hypothetical protein